MFGEGAGFGGGTEGGVEARLGPENVGSSWLALHCFTNELYAFSLINCMISFLARNSTMGL